MASSAVLKRGATVGTRINKLFSPFCSGSAIPSVQRTFKTKSSKFSASNRDVEKQRRPDHELSYEQSRFIGLFYDTKNANRREPFYEMWHVNRDKKKPQTLTITLGIPSLYRDNVKVSRELNTLIFSFEAEKEPEEWDWKKNFSKRLEFPEDIFKADEFKSEMTNGYLTIEVPMKFEVKDERYMRFFEMCRR